MPTLTNPTASPPPAQPARVAPISARRRLSLRKRIAFSLIIWCIACTAVLAIGEIVFRAERSTSWYRLKTSVAGQPPAGWAVYDSELGYRNRPDWGDHNSAGMRDGPLGPKKNAFRVLWVGDSLGYYGESAGDTCPGRLEKWLNDNKRQGSCEVLNASTKGYTNYQELVYLKRRGLEFEPDLVVLGFCLNDLHKSLHNFVVLDGQIVATSNHFNDNVERSLLPRGWVGSLVRPSLFLTWLWTKSNAALVDLGFRNGYLFDCRVDTHTAWQDMPWDTIERQLAKMITVCRARKVSLAVVVFPHALQYREDYLKRDRDYVLKPQRKLAEISRELHVPVLDLYPSFSGESHFLEDQIHLTAEARGIAARRIGEFLAKKRLVPAAATSSE